MQAQAVVAAEPRAVELRQVRVPEPGPEDVVIRVAHSWISPGTEGSFVRGERKDGETPLAPHDPPPFPHVPGYQKVGVVEWTGAAVRDLAAGDMVAATISHVSEMAFPFAGHISPAITHCSQVWKVPHGVDPVALSGFVLAQVGYNCAMRPVLAAGDSAVVIGDGLVGQWTAQALAGRGARVMLVGRHDARLAAFAAGSLDALVNARAADPLAAAQAWTPEGLQVAVDTVGSVASLAPAVGSVPAPRRADVYRPPVRLSLHAGPAGA